MLRRKIIAIILVILMTLICFPQGTKAAATSFTVGFEVEYDYNSAFEVQRLVNKERSGSGLKTLVMDKDLLETAMQRAVELVVYYGHTRPDGSSCFDIFPDNNYGMAENIAIWQSSASAVNDAWVKSSGHYQNMMNSSYNAIGVGAIKYNGKMYWVECFGNTQGYTSVSSASYSNKKGEAKVDFTTSYASISNISLAKSNIKVNEKTYVQCDTKGNWTNVRGARFYNVSINNSNAYIDNGYIVGRKEGSAAISANGNSFNLKISGTAELPEPEIEQPETADIFKAKDGSWYYYENGIINYKYVGLAKRHAVNKWFYVEKGKVEFKFNGLAKNPQNNNWYYCQSGELNTSFNGLAKNPKNGKWFHCDEGRVNFAYNGISYNPKNGRYFYCKAGQGVPFGTTGIVKDTNGLEANSWVYIRSGEYIEDYTGICKSPANGKYYLVMNGKVNFSYTGNYKGYKVVRGCVENYK